MKKLMSRREGERLMKITKFELGMWIFANHQQNAARGIAGEWVA